MNQWMIVPSLDDVVWAELLGGGTVKRLRRNQAVIDRLLVHGWITHTSRKDEFAITEQGRHVAERRLTNQWPSWREDIASLRLVGMSPEDDGAWRLLERAKTPQLPRHLNQINRRTLNAWERRHSKVSSKTPSENFADVQVTIDEVVRLRLPPESTLVLNDGQVVDCDAQQRLWGEVLIPERAWASIQAIDAPRSRLVFSIENKGAFVDFPTVGTAVLVFVPGDNLTALRRLTSRVRKQPIIHFGDLDPKGIDIFQSLVSGGLPVHHFVPSYAEEFLLTHAQPCKTPWSGQDSAPLHPVVSRLASNSLWLEQEALLLDHRFEPEINSLIERISKEVRLEEQRPLSQ